MQRIFVFLALLFVACNGKNSAEETSNLKSIDSNTANNPLPVHTERILIQSFNQLPSIINNCSAVFVADTSAEQSRNYYFVSNLKGVAFIKINNRLMELRLVKQTNIDKFTVNELYVNDEVEVDLKVREMDVPMNAEWNYKGVLVVKRGEEREVINISGKLGC